MRYISENLKQSFRSWGKGEVVIALLLYIFAGSATSPVGLIGDATVIKIGAWFGVSVAVWFALLVLIVTPARMWYKAQREIKDLREKVDADEPATARFDVKSEGQMGGQTAGVIQNVRQQPRTLRNADGDEKKDGKDGE